MEVAKLKRILRCFQLASGLKINLTKSHLVGVGCPRENIFRFFLTSFIVKLSVYWLAYRSEFEVSIDLESGGGKVCIYHLGEESHLLDHPCLVFKYTTCLCTRCQQW